MGGRGFNGGGGPGEGILKDEEPLLGCEPVVLPRANRSPSPYIAINCAAAVGCLELPAAAAGGTGMDLEDAEGLAEEARARG
jgi:hypothetical protein